MYSPSLLVKEAIGKNNQVILNFNGMSMYPTLKDGMKLKIVKVPPAALKPSDIIVYSQTNMIVAHRLIAILENKGKSVLITKGDNQPFGGVSLVQEADLIGQAVSAFYENNPTENLLVKNRLIDFFYVFMGRAYLFFKKNNSFFPNFLRIPIKYFVGYLYRLSYSQ